MASNPLDPCSQISTVAADPSNKCDNSVPTSCSDLINLCLCQTDPPESPENIDSKCVNDIITRPWAPPPPTNPGCNPLSISITNKQDDSGSVSPDNIKLKGSVNYVGKDPCLPELNLELITNPTFFRGGGAPAARGWGISEYGHIPGIGDPWKGIRVCSENCCDYPNPQQYLASGFGAESFIPNDNVGCSTPFDECQYKYIWAKKIARWGLIGPVLCVVENFTVSEQVEISYVNDAGTATTRTIPISWNYELKMLPTVISGDTSILGSSSNSSCGGLPFIPNLNNNQNNIIDGSITETFEAYNIKENTDRLTSGSSSPYTELHMTPGLEVVSLEKTGFSVKPIMKGTVVLAYGWVPWSSISADNNGPNAQEVASKCDCEIIWFIDVPNAVEGNCLPTTAPLQADSMLPSRKISSAGMFFGIASNENRV